MNFLKIIICFFSLSLLNIGIVQANMIKIDYDKVQKIPVFCYHDVVNVDGNEDNIKDFYTITTGRLEEHFKLFKENGVNPISMKQYMDFVEGKGTLPDNPIILSFDDGYISLYENIYPLLKKYNYPAVFSLIVSYMETSAFNDASLKMVSWNQVKEMEQSGLVTIASHSYNLHNFVVANRYGDRHHNASTIWWNSGQYESEEDFNNRIKNDLLMGKNVLEENIGHSSNILVWPFGAYNQYDIDLAKSLGYEYQLLLNDDVKTNDEGLLSRFIITNDLTDANLLKLLNHKMPKPNMVAGQIDIDMIYDSLPEQFERNIDAAINKLYDMNANTVFLQTFSDEDGDGNVDEVYFYTNKMKVKADVFSHVVIRLKEAGFRVYAWMPVLSCSWLTEDANDIITASEIENRGWYKRATPFSPNVKAKAKALIKDLVLYAPIDGILFQDDLYMNDFEDFSPYAKAEFKQRFNQELTQDILDENDELKAEWTRVKTKVLNDLTVELIEEAKYYRPEIMTARNIYSTLITEPQSEEWFAQNYQDYLDIYDYVVIMAYLEMENEQIDNQEIKDKWLKELISKALQDTRGSQKAVFKLQGYDWNKDVWIDNKEQLRRINLIKKEKGLNIAQYPVNIFDN